MLGINCKLYRNTGSYGSPTWTAIDLVSDATLTPTWDEADGSARVSYGKQTSKTLIGIEVSAKVRASLTDAGYLALLSALNSQSTLLDILVLDGPSTTNGVQGYRADFGVFGAPEDQAMGSVIYRDFTLKPGISDNLLKAVTVSAGAPVFSNIAA